ncbi:hypothetical protein ANCCAN_28994 [Ancylostoma caninum]|uniref:Uncharacterized protein n=1 Tax=Ancylostoma caninum TaxID=29170 RepID=A0A368F305_ANCCA|nr:hypothetical protein ANCCAN_28994 [Ancylostoma caninum]
MRRNLSFTDTRRNARMPVSTRLQPTLVFQKTRNSIRPTALSVPLRANPRRQQPLRRLTSPPKRPQHRYSPRRRWKRPPERSQPQQWSQLQQLS